jgi:monoterpene epsilon-lactone hydrolase
MTEPTEPTTSGRLVPERPLPAPASVSPHAQAMLAMPWREGEPYPPVDDPEAWRRYIRQMDDGLQQMMAPGVASSRAEVHADALDGVPAFRITPEHLQPALEGWVQLDIHGGALIMGGGESCRIMGIRAAERAGLPTWSVDYRMPPDHPYPTPLDDCMTAYRALLRDHPPSRIVIEGGSAGGNLAAALVLRARDEGLPLPAGLVLITPEVDLTESGDSFATNLGVDNVLTRRLMPANLLYANGHDLAHPYLSPLFGDFTRGFPPTFVQAGTRDLFLSNAVRMHRALWRAEVPVELHIFEAMPHGGFFGAPEDHELEAAVRRFVGSLTPRP